MLGSVTLLNSEVKTFQAEKKRIKPYGLRLARHENEKVLDSFHALALSVAKRMKHYLPRETAEHEHSFIYSVCLGHSHRSGGCSGTKSPNRTMFCYVSFY